MCCDGTLFERATTRPQEADRLRGFGLTILADEAHFALPCHLLDGSRCTIYADRFRICRTFRCSLLTALDAGRVTADRAIALVAEAKRLRADVARIDPAAVQVRHRRERIADSAGWASVSDAQQRRRDAETYLRLSTLDRFLRKHFYKSATAGTPPVVAA